MGTTNGTRIPMFLIHVSCLWWCVCCCGCGDGGGNDGLRVLQWEEWSTYSVGVVMTINDTDILDIRTSLISQFAVVVCLLLVVGVCEGNLISYALIEPASYILKVLANVRILLVIR